MVFFSSWRNIGVAIVENSFVVPVTAVTWKDFYGVYAASFDGVAFDNLISLYGCNSGIR